MIKKINEDFKGVEDGTYLLIKKECIKVGKILLFKKNKIRAIKLIGTVIDIYGHGYFAWVLMKNIMTLI